MKEFTLHGHKTVAELLQEARIYFGAPCGGHGRCGKCRVVSHCDMIQARAVDLAANPVFMDAYIDNMQFVLADSDSL